MRPKTIEEITQERDALQSIVKSAQDHSAECDRVLSLLVAGGILTTRQIEIARKFAQDVKPEGNPE